MGYALRREPGQGRRREIEVALTAAEVLLTAAGEWSADEQLQLARMLQPHLADWLVELAELAVSEP